MSDLDETLNAITKDLEVKNRVRDQALVESRQIVRIAANAIRALHRGDISQAKEGLVRGRDMVRTAREVLTTQPDLYWAGYVQDAQKEYAEACIVAGMIAGANIPGPEELGVERAPYLNGLAEAASEMRRYVLDTIRKGAPEGMAEAERVLGIMDDVYTGLISVDFPDSITGGLRRTTDSLRAVLERTRGDLTMSIRQSQLERALRADAASLKRD